jgi:RNA polymerase sigma-70 factor, ECF subfamily
LAGTRIQTDEELMQAIAGGDRTALGHLYDRFAGLLLGLGRRFLDEREAEDLVHDVFLEVWRQAGDFDPERGTARSWLVTRLRSRALDRRKSPRLARVSALDAVHLEAVAGPYEDPSLNADRERVRHILLQLPAEQRICLELGYYEGLSSTEIASRAGVPVGTVKSRVAAGLAKLRAVLERTGT